MKLCMIGTGYVGLVSGVCFSDLGNEVVCVDTDETKINNLKKSIIPIYEPGLEELVKKNYKAGRLSFTTDLHTAVKNSKIIFICVGTPTKKNGIGANLNQIFNASKELRNHIKTFKIIINKSTVPVTTGDKVEKIISQKVKKKYFSVVSNPEFLREGEAIRDFIYPDRIVIGTEDKKSNKILKQLYSPLISKGAKYLNTSRRAAELIKYASNAFLATKITYINEIANMCEKLNINVEDVVDIETSSSKLYGVEEGGNEPSVDIFETFKGKPGDKFKYRRRSDKPGGEDFEFQRPGSDVWEQATDTDARTAINQLYTGDYEGKDLVISPIEKVSPYKKGIGKYTKKAKGKRGYKMKRK